MRETVRSTRWDCDGICGTTEVRTDTMQDVPPEGWRVVHILPIHLNLVLEGDPHSVLVLCTACFAQFREMLRDE